MNQIYVVFFLTILKIEILNTLLQKMETKKTKKFFEIDSF